jgi:hypothetical protein
MAGGPAAGHRWGAGAGKPQAAGMRRGRPRPVLDSGTLLNALLRRGACAPLPAPDDQALSRWLNQRSSQAPPARNRVGPPASGSWRCARTHARRRACARKSAPCVRRAHDNHGRRTGDAGPVGLRAMQAALLHPAFGAWPVSGMARCASAAGMMVSCCLHLLTPACCREHMARIHRDLNHGSAYAKPCTVLRGSLRAAGSLSADVSARR